MLVPKALFHSYMKVIFYKSLSKTDLRGTMDGLIKWSNDHEPFNVPKVAQPHPSAWCRNRHGKCASKRIKVTAKAEL